MENKTPNPYSIALMDAGGKKLMRLQYEGFDMMCPFKSRVPIQQGKIASNIAYANQECDCFCPHFSYNDKENKNSVSLSCGSGRLIFVEQPKTKTQFEVIK